MIVVDCSHAKNNNLGKGVVDGLTCLVAVAILNQGLPPPAVSPTHLTPTQHDADAGGFVAATSIARIRPGF